VDAPRAARAPKLSWKERQELKDLPARIEDLEREQAELSRQLADPEFYRADAAQVKEANSRYQELEGLLLTALERWTELEGKA
jgi:ATP-binding cassette subfamily F protein uup